MSKVYFSPLVYIKERKLIIKRQLSLYERVTLQSKFDVTLLIFAPARRCVGWWNLLIFLILRLRSLAKLTVEVGFLVQKDESSPRGATYTYSKLKLFFLLCPKSKQ